MKLAFELLIHIVVRADLNEMQMATLAVNLWKLSKKNKTIDSGNEVKLLLFIFFFYTSLYWLYFSSTNSKHTIIFIFFFSGKNDNVYSRFL